MVDVVEDDFTRSTDANLVDHIATITGGQWTLFEETGTAFLRIRQVNDSVTSNAVHTSDRAMYASSPDPTEADVDVVVTVRDNGIGSGDDPGGVFARATDTDNYYAVGTYRDSSNPDKRLIKKVGGVVTELSTANTGLSSGDRLKLEVRGSSIAVYHDTGAGFGAAIMSATDSDLPSAGKAGIWMGNVLVGSNDISPSFVIDDYKLEEFSSGPASGQPVWTRRGGLWFPRIGRGF